MLESSFCFNPIYDLNSVPIVHKDKIAHFHINKCEIDLSECATSKLDFGYLACYLDNSTNDGRVEFVAAHRCLRPPSRKVRFGV